MGSETPTDIPDAGALKHVYLHPDSADLFFDRCLLQRCLRRYAPEPVDRLD